MQTFLPYASYTRSAEVLDLQRLGKQVIETGQIVRALVDPDYGWQHHPATRMWRGHTFELLVYLSEVHAEWERRRDTSHQAVANLYRWLAERNVHPVDLPGLYPPSWLGDPDFHASHRSNLLRKDPEHYGRYGWTEPNDLPYVWPKEAARVLP